MEIQKLENMRVKEAVALNITYLVFLAFITFFIWQWPETPFRFFFIVAALILFCKSRFKNDIKKRILHPTNFSTSTKIRKRYSARRLGQRATIE